MKQNAFTPFLRQRSHQVEELLSKLVMVDYKVIGDNMVADLGYCKVIKTIPFYGKPTFAVESATGKPYCHGVSILRAVEVILMKHW